LVICITSLNLFLLFLTAPSLSAQDSKNIDLKDLDHREVWSLEKESRADFLIKLANCVSGICQQSINELGYKDGNKIPLPSNGRTIIFLRENPPIEEYQIFLDLAEHFEGLDLKVWNIIIFDSLSPSKHNCFHSFYRP